MVRSWASKAAEPLASAPRRSSALARVPSFSDAYVLIRHVVEIQFGWLLDLYDIHSLYNFLYNVILTQPTHEIKVQHTHAQMSKTTPRLDETTLSGMRGYTYPVLKVEGCKLDSFRSSRLYIIL